MTAFDDFKKAKEASQMNLPGLGKSFGESARNAAKNVPNAFASGMGMAAAGAAVAGAGMAASKIYDAITKKRDFSAMLEHNADLHEAYERDPKRFNLMFSSLRTMNPGFSKDPLVAGTYMRRMVESPSHAGGIAVEALGHKEDTKGPLGDAFLRGGLEGVKR